MSMLDIYPVKDKTFLVFGLARSGIATVKWLLDRGAIVFVYDNDQTKQKEAIQLGAKQWEMDCHTSSWKSLSALIQSPGIPLTHPISNLAREHFVPIIGDCDLFRMAHKNATIVGITGTNGKSTTTALVGHILREAGIPVAVGGNIGVPVLSLPDLPSEGIYVLELSSYQLELSHGLFLNYIGWVNATPDHLDRHGTMESYMRAKGKIFDFLDESAQVVISTDDEWSRQYFHKLEINHPVSVLSVSLKMKKDQSGICIQDQHLYEVKAKEEIDIADLTLFNRLRGQHNHQNIGIAYGLCRQIGLSPEQIIKGISSFPGLAHRQEWVGEKDGVIFINDSKATNAEAASKSLTSFDHIFWIAGGQPKSDGIGALRCFFPKIHQALLIGEAQDEFARTIGQEIPVSRCGDLKSATARAFTLARDYIGKVKVEGNKKTNVVVLLSPACASFDQFRDFEHRGEVFKEIVEELIH